MKIAFLYSSWVIGGRPIVEKELLTSKRGLTGSELSCYMFSQKMRERGHDARLFWGKETAAAQALEWDVAYAWVDPEPLNGVRARLRMLNQQCNDFNYLQPGFSRALDVFTSPSKWEIVPNGCDSSQYTAAKVPGRVLYASSPDRGLHLLLQAWPEIKRRVPHAHLRVLYELEAWAKNLRDNTWPDPGIQECGQRARYIELALARMKHLDVVAVDSVSRQDMAREMAEAEVLAYPCDTIRFTEGFSVTTLEACAAGAIPVINPVDSLGHIYGELPSASGVGAFHDRVCAALDSSHANVRWQNECREIAKKIAARHEWPVLAERLESIVLRHLGEAKAAE
jgi:glycosyltransferase involved in cell wall biosynthesis